MPSNMIRFMLRVILSGGILLLVALVYRGALHTSFWGDDYYNLYNLNLIDSEGYLYYIFNGIAGPSGRPLSLLTFAWQHESWPLDSYSFKVVNFGIHLINGILIYFLGRRLVPGVSSTGSGRELLPLLTAALWLLHPIQITTVLYVVQRMTQLAVFATLAGLYGYLYFREKYIATSSLNNLAGMSFSVGGGMVLGVLAKEIGILLPLYILVLEGTLLSCMFKDIRSRWWGGCFLIAPLAVLAGYMLMNFNSTLLDFQTRHFGMLERLLTQPMVLFDYLAKIILPQRGAYSIFNDDFPVVTGWLMPPEMIVYLIGIVALLGLGWHYRRRCPIFGFAVLWFFAGHALESSFLSLELYYEHRNYLPLLGPCVLAAWFVTRLCDKYGDRLGYMAALVMMALLASVTAKETASYEDPYLKAVERASVQPTSVRAWSHLMDLYVLMDDYDRYLATFSQITTNHNHALLLYIKKVYFTACLFKREVPERDWDEIFANLDLDEWYARGTIGALDEIVEAMLNRDCRLVNPYRFVELIIRLTDQPRYFKYGDMLHQLASLVCIHIGDGECALTNINEAIRLNPLPKYFELHLKLLIGMQDREGAQATLAEYRNYLKKNRRLIIANKAGLDSLDKQVLQMADATRGDESRSGAETAQDPTL
jgi:tetratricopeptide (TPR) repeat protein